MNSSTYGHCTRTTQARTHAPESDRGSRLANYIVDVFFIALLAAPFLIFESPASIQEAVTASSPSNANVVAAAPAANVPNPAYGPE